MSAYTQPIIRFGLITPAVFNCVLLGVLLGGVSKLRENRADKEARYEEQTQRLAALKTLEAKLAPKRKTFDDQKKLLEADPGQLFTRILDSLLPKYKEIELERTSLIFPLERGRVGRQLQAEAGRVKCSFQGGLGPMQEALLQVESLMPQAVLEEMRITRKADLLLNQPEHLVLDTTHTCWMAREEKE